MNRTLLPVVTLTLAIHSLVTSAAFAETPADVTQKVVAAADSLIGKLSKEQQEKVQFAFDDEEQRRRWSNLPTGIVRREGLRMGDLSAEQKEAVFSVLRATLSEKGFQQVVDNIEGDEALRQKERNGRLVFGRDEYYFSILGEPSTQTPWMWQFGGHHFAINATVVGERITLAPSLTGGQPIHYTLNGKAVHQVAEESEKAFELINALDEAQKKIAVLSAKHPQMLYGPGKDAEKAVPEGISAAAMNARQRTLLLELIEARVGILNSVQASSAMDRIRSDVEKLSFAWYGPTKPGSAAGFRIFGPTVVIEYSPQDMGGDAREHLHAMFRDPTNDYGAGWRASK